MKENISMQDINKFAPKGFSFREDKQGKIWVENDNNKNMNHFENIGYTGLTVDNLRAAFKPFYNFTHKKEDGKLIEDTIEVLPLSASKEEKEKSVGNYMRSRSYSVEVAGAHLGLKQNLEGFFESGFQSLNTYLEFVDKRIDNAEEYQKNAKEKKELEANPPKKGFLDFGYNKKYSEWKKGLDSFDDNKNEIEKSRKALQDKSIKSLEGLKNDYYGGLFTQMLLQSTMSAVEVDVKNHYTHLQEQHDANRVFNRQSKVRDKLKVHGIESGEVSGVVKADAKAKAKINQTEYKEPTREDKLKKAHNNLIEKTFGRS